MALREWPDFQTALRIAAASYALAGRLRGGAATPANGCRSSIPGLRISNLEDELGPYDRPDFIARYAEGLRAAGLPD